MTKGEVSRAVRDALHRLNEWQDVTGALHGSYESEVESIVEDAVHIGIRAALGLPYIGVEDDALTSGYTEQVGGKG
jgi:hypothetical protein